VVWAEFRARNRRNTIRSVTSWFNLFIRAY